MCAEHSAERGHHPAAPWPSKGSPALWPGGSGENSSQSRSTAAPGLPPASSASSPSPSPASTSTMSAAGRSAFLLRPALAPSTARRGRPRLAEGPVVMHGRAGPAAARCLLLRAFTVAGLMQDICRRCGTPQRKCSTAWARASVSRLQKLRGQAATILSSIPRSSDWKASRLTSSVHLPAPPFVTRQQTLKHGVPVPSGDCLSGHHLSCTEQQLGAP